MFTHALEAAEAAAAEVERSAEQRTPLSGLRAGRDDARAALIRERECHLADNEQEQAAHPRRASSPDGRGSGGQGVSPRSHSAPATRASTAAAAPDEAAAASVAETAVAPGDESAPASPEPVPVPAAPEAPRTTPEASRRSSSIRRSFTSLFSSTDSEKKESTEKKAKKAKKNKKNKAATSSEALMEHAPQADVQQPASVVGPSAACSPQSSPTAAREARAAAAARRASRAARAQASLLRTASVGPFAAHSPQREDAKLAALIRDRDRLLAEKEQSWEASNAMAALVRHQDRALARSHTYPVSSRASAHDPIAHSPRQLLMATMARNNALSAHSSPARGQTPRGNTSPRGAAPQLQQQPRSPALTAQRGASVASLLRRQLLQARGSAAAADQQPRQQPACGATTSSARSPQSSLPTAAASPNGGGSGGVGQPASPASRSHSAPATRASAPQATPGAAPQVAQDASGCRLTGSQSEKARMAVLEGRLRFRASRAAPLTGSCAAPQASLQRTASVGPSAARSPQSSPAAARDAPAAARREDALAALIRERERLLAEEEQEQTEHPQGASSPNGGSGGGQPASPASRSHNAPATRASTASAAPDEAAAAPQAVRPDVAPPHAPPDGRGVSTAGTGAESPHEQAAHRCVDHQPSAIEAAGRSAECDANHDTVDRRSSDTGTSSDTTFSDTTSSGVVSGREGVGEAVAPDMSTVDAHRGAYTTASLEAWMEAWAAPQADVQQPASVVGPSAACSPQSSPTAERDAPTSADARSEDALAALIRGLEQQLAEKEQEQTEHPQGASSPNGGSGGGQPASPASRSHSAPTVSAAPIRERKRLLAETEQESREANNAEPTSLRLEAKQGNVENVRLLLQQSADVNVRDERGNTALHHAARGGHSDVVALLARRDPEVCTVPNAKGYTPLHFAAQAEWGNIFDKPPKAEYCDVVEKLLEQNAEACSAVAKNGRTPLHLAAYNGTDEALRLLLERNASVCATPDADGNTPVHLFVTAAPAWSAATTTKLQMLLLHNSKVCSVPNNNGRTPLHQAALAGWDMSVVRMLYEHNIEACSVKDNDARTPLHLAASRGHCDTVGALLQLNPSVVTEPDTHMRTPLWIAASLRHEKTVRVLLQHMPDVGAEACTAPDKDGRTPLHEAAHEALEAIALLLQHSADARNMQDKNGRTPLHMLVGRGASVQTIELFLQGDDSACALQDKYDQTPLDVAMEYESNSYKVVQLLRYDHTGRRRKCYR